MLNKNELEKYLQKCLSTGADFAEIFQEESINKNIALSDKKVQNIHSNFIKGIGIRICLKDKTAYGCTNNINNIDNIISRLLSNFSNTPINKDIILPEKTIYKDDINIPHNNYSVTEKDFNDNLVSSKSTEKKKETLYL